MHNAAKAYFQTHVTTTSQGNLLILLYDAAIKNLRLAKDKIAVKDYAQKGILISKALDILAELQSSLNANVGGELAENLQKLYFWCSTRLLHANLKMDIEAVEEVARILSGLRDAYSEINGTVPQPASSTGANPVQPIRPAGAAAPKPTARADVPPPAENATQPRSVYGVPPMMAGQRPRPASAPVNPAAYATPAPTTGIRPPVQAGPNAQTLVSAVAPASASTAPRPEAKPAPSPYGAPAQAASTTPPGAPVGQPAQAAPADASGLPLQPGHAVQSTPARRGLAAYAALKNKTGA